MSNHADLGHSETPPVLLIQNGLRRRMAKGQGFSIDRTSSL